MLDYKAIGRRIAYHRKRACFTQADLAEKLGISESYVSQVERATTKISLDRLSEIAEVLKIDICSLLSDTNINSENYCLSEFVEIIRSWNPVNKEFLLNLLKCANEQFSSTNK